MLTLAPADCSQAGSYSQAQLGPKYAPITLYQGDDALFIAEVYLENGTPADLAGYVAHAQIRKDYADSEPVIAYTILTYIEAHEVLLPIPKEATALLGGKYVWDVQLVASDGTTTTILRGDVTTMLEVTRV
jgi:hypothetical protein